MAMCLKCKKSVLDDVKFCPDCGGKIKHEQPKKEISHYDEKKSKKWLWVSLGIAGVIIIILLWIIFTGRMSTFQDSSSCSVGYFWSGSECCRDADENNLCDKDQEYLEFEFNNCPINSWGDCVKPCERKCAEYGLRIAVSAKHGEELASHPGPGDMFYCNCVSW